MELLKVSAMNIFIRKKSLHKVGVPNQLTGEKKKEKVACSKKLLGMVGPDEPKDCATK